MGPRSLEAAKAGFRQVGAFLHRIHISLHVRPWPHADPSVQHEPSRLRHARSLHTSRCVGPSLPTLRISLIRIRYLLRNANFPRAHIRTSDLRGAAPHRAIPEARDGRTSASATPRSNTAGGRGQPRRAGGLHRHPSRSSYGDSPGSLAPHARSVSTSLGSLRPAGYAYSHSRIP